MSSTTFDVFNESHFADRIQTRKPKGRKKAVQHAESLRNRSSSNPGNSLVIRSANAVPNDNHHQLFDLWQYGKLYEQHDR
jgi:hypothetical protein